MKKYISCLLCVILLSMICSAQDNNKTAAINAINELVNNYRQKPLLSFDLAYYYSEEKTPVVYGDSLKGHCRMNGSSYWYLLDSTEVIYGKEYVVILYKQDKIMYLSKPAATAVSQLNPLAMFDSVLLNNKQLAFSYNRSENEKIITINFTGGGPYRKLEYHIDETTGLLVRLISLVKSSLLYDKDANENIAGNGYAIVSTVFSNYRENSFDPNLFDMSKYFIKQGKAYTTVAPYDTYKIFEGNTGL